MRSRRQYRAFSGVLLIVAVVGCGTTRMTDTARTATEMLLVSQAADRAIAQIDFSPLEGRTVFLDPSGISDKEVADKGYLVSLVRQQLVAYGALLQDDKTRAEYMVDLRAGSLGTDRHSMLVGIPAFQLPSVVPGLPTNIPEISMMKKNDQRGVVKVGVFAYNRISGRALWQSGTVQAESLAKDTWFMGAGPFSRGTIRKRTELAGQPLPSVPTLFGDHQTQTSPEPLGEHYFTNHQAPTPPLPIPAAILAVTGAAALADRPVVR
jgi:hypothetical protein